MARDLLIAAALAAMALTGQAHAATAAKFNPRDLEGVWMNDNTLDEQRAHSVKGLKLKR